MLFQVKKFIPRLLFPCLKIENGFKLQTNFLFTGFSCLSLPFEKRKRGYYLRFYNLVQLRDSFSTFFETILILRHRSMIPSNKFRSSIDSIEISLQSGSSIVHFGSITEVISIHSKKRSTLWPFKKMERKVLYP